MSDRLVPLPDLAATAGFGAQIAGVLRKGDVVALSGALGAGKTTLARAILRAAGYAGEVPSPTFTILETYDPPAVCLPIVHADFYRLNQPSEAEELGLADYRQDAALLAEWPERVGGFAGEVNYLGIHLQAREEDRIARIEMGPGWQGRIA